MKFTCLTIRFYLPFVFGMFFLLIVSTADVRAQQVIPYFDCAEPIYSNGTLVQIKSYFGYYNPSASNVVIQRGLNNFMIPPSSADHPPTTFLPGYHEKVFSTITNSTDSKIWYLGSLNAVMKPASATLCGTDAMTYQGKLSAAGATANGSYDMQFKFYDFPTGGTAHPKVLTVDNVAVTNGIFAVSLNVAHIFDDLLKSGYMEIGIRQAGDASPYTILDPRQPITSAPFALRAERAVNADNATNATNATNAANATNVTGGTIQLQTITGPPSSTTTSGGCYINVGGVSSLEVGSMRFDVVNNKLYVCTRTGWKSVTLQ